MTNKTTFQLSSLRYRRDSLADDGVTPLNGSDFDAQESTKKHNLANGVRAISSLVPGVADAASTVHSRLSLDRALDVFICNSPDIQAFSLAGRPDGPIVIGLTSGLINIMPHDELLFVLGHEVGHNVLEHHRYPSPGTGNNDLGMLNTLSLHRAAEISSDRVGFLACEDRDSSWRSLLRIASGLSDQHLRFDFAGYLDQFRELRDLGGTSSELMSTHPIAAVRMRALMWFEMSETFSRYHGKNTGWAIDQETMDQRIEKDLATVCGFRLHEINDRALQQAYTWGILAILVADLRISKAEQAVVAKVLGEEEAAKAIAFAREHGPEAILSKLEGCLQEIHTMPREPKEALLGKLQDVSLQADGPNHLKQSVLELIMRRLCLR